MVSMTRDGKFGVEGEMWISRRARGVRGWMGRTQYLLHDTGLALREGDVATRLILDELDLDLAALTAGLVIVVVVVLGAHATALGAAVVRAVAGLLQVIMTRREFLLADRSHIGHDSS